NEWNVDVEIDGIIAGPTSTISFNTDGTFNSGTFNATLPLLPGANDLNISLDFSKMTQFAGDFTALAFNQNGYTYGDLQSVSVDTTGTITGSYSNGQSRKLAQVAIATFTNPSGLIKAGNNLFQFSNNSGEPDKGIPGISGRGIIKPETLEMSNVDLSQEFVDMIITQRGFQANSRVITTSDQVLEELVNLRR
ncbi:MAG: flagellar hook-basal body complex protein, partial [Bacillota bacterium]